MEHIKNAFMNAFNKDYSKIRFFESESMKDIRGHVDFLDVNGLETGRHFLRFRMYPDQPLFSEPFVNSVFAFSNFNRLFEINKTIRNKIYSVNDAFSIFLNNNNFSRFLLTSGTISKKSIYNFRNPTEGAYAMSLADDIGCTVTSSVNGSYRYMTNYRLRRYFGVTRDNKIVTFPIIYFPEYLSLYFHADTQTFYKLPNSLVGLVTVDDIIEHSSIFTDSDVDVFVDQLIMMYLKNLHKEIHEVVVDMPADYLSTKIDLLMMKTI